MRININITQIGLAEAILVAFPMLAMVLLNLFLGTSDYGQLVYLITVSNFYLIFVVFGVDLLGSRLIYESEDTVRVFYELVVFKAINFLIGLFPFILMSFLLNMLWEMLLFIPLILSEMLGISVYYLGLKENRGLLNYRIKSKSLGLFLLFIFLLLDCGIYSYPFALFGVMIFDLIIVMRIFRRLRRWTFNYSLYIHYLRMSWPLAGSSILVTAVAGGGKLIIGNIFNNYTLGIYDIVDKVLRAFKLPQVVYNKYLVATIKDDLRSVVKHLKETVALNLMLALVLLVAFRFFIPLMFDLPVQIELKKFEWLVLTILSVGISQYLVFIVSIVKKYPVIQLGVLLLGFALFYGLIYVFDIERVEDFVLILNLQELVITAALIITLKFIIR